MRLLSGLSPRSYRLALCVKVVVGAGCGLRKESLAVARSGAAIAR